MSWQVLEGDCRKVLATLPERSVQMVATSPPYFGLRDYGTATWEDGDKGCDHLGPPKASDKSSLKNDGRPNPGRKQYELEATVPYRSVCGKCGARRVDNQLGLEPTPDEFCAALVEVFREVRRVLRDDGTVWLNLGDSYAANRTYQVHNTRGASEHTYSQGASVPDGLKPKDLLMIPARVAMALQADGWWLRSEIVWAKPNPMPESVTDRPTRAHEQVFLLTKNARYFYDADGIREPHESPRPNGRWTGPVATTGDNNGRRLEEPSPAGRNKRSVWTIATQPFRGAHFAVFPEKLVESMILAGSSPQACGVCGAPWKRSAGPRELDLSRPQARRAQELAEAAGLTAAHIAAIRACGVGDAGKAQVTQDGYGKNDAAIQALADEAKAALGGYHREFLLARPQSGALAPTCAHDDDSGASVVLDPFCGAGTAGAVALRHGRSFVGVELNPEYAEMARQRIRDDQPLMNTVSEVA